jgi:MarR family transcriptional regulator, organic hydroperoxide resistance regulator
VEKAELADRIMALFKRMGRMQMQRAFEPWRKLDVPLAQLKSLFMIHIRGSLTSRQLAAHLRVTPGDVTSIVDRLVAQGLVTRGENPGDRRVVLLHLTEKGGNVITDIHSSGLNLMRGTLIRMNRDDIEALYRGINAMLTIVEEDNKEIADDSHCQEQGACPLKPPPDVAGGPPAKPPP